MIWELREVSDVEYTLDDSGVYVVVHRVERKETHKEYAGVRVLVRADLMQEGLNMKDAADPIFNPNPTTDEPIISFIGTANAVRKHLIRFLVDHEREGEQFTVGWPISHEHCSYIGYELLRAETDPNYMQD